MELEWHVDGFDDEASLAIRGVEGFGPEIREILNEASLAALKVMMARVPKGRQTLSGRGGAEHRTIYSSLGRGPVAFRPGGAGGGGFYEIRVGPINNPPDHLDFVFHGTKGIDPSPFARNRGSDRPSDVRESDRGRMTSYMSNQMQRGNIGKLMVFQKLGEMPVFTFHRAGQRPQQEWFHAAQREASRVINKRMRQLFRLRHPKN